MFNLFKKNIEPKKDDKKKVECSGDPSCPMCHIGDETLGVLEKEAKNDEQERHKN